MGQHIADNVCLCEWCDWDNICF